MSIELLDTEEPQEDTANNEVGASHLLTSVIPVLQLVVVVCCCLLLFYLWSKLHPVYLC